jgi:NitT/TauT family transport system ATP-binding protein/nitrate/nitrite transport system substrate-binding protein
MSDVISLSKARERGTKMRIGVLRLTDAAPVILAHEFGFFAEEGIDSEVHVEPSWANIADKLTFGFLDAAIILPPLAFAIELGLRGATQKLIIPYNISLGGNTVTLAKSLGERVRQRGRAANISYAEAFARCLKEDDAPPILGIVHAYSNHNLLLRYWLATAGLLAGRDIKLSVVPPARAVEALESRQIAGFCAGAPWGEVAARAGVGLSIATTHNIWRNAPEKAFAVRGRWADENADALRGALRALLRSAQFCDDPQNASYTAALLSRRKYLDVDSHAIIASLLGGAAKMRDDAPENASIFFRYAANFPWRSHGQWFLAEMLRWNLLKPDTDVGAVAERVYRPDLFRQAAASLSVSAPLADSKPEGAHGSGWEVPGSAGTIAMAADRFCDGAVFEAVLLKNPAIS